VGIKLCVGSPREVYALFEEMARQALFPDYIAIDGGEGGTGAAPKPYLDGFGMPLLPALCAVQRGLVNVGIRDRTKVFAAGKLINAAKWVQALSLGADAVYTARGFMLALGCIQALQCANNTCPVGITTHDPTLQHGLVVEDKSRRVQNYVEGVCHDFDDLLASVGVRSAGELSVGHLYIPAQSVIAGEGVS
jgi:glutamate synthase domain-containing protein 2